MKYIVNNVMKEIKKMVKKRWVEKLLDSDDKRVSASTVFLLLTSLTAILLLLVPAIVLLIEVKYNHTIMTDISGLASYVGAVSTIFISGGLLKGWTTYNNYKFKPHNHEDDYEDDCGDDDNVICD
jgi:hypothetical protein